MSRAWETVSTSAEDVPTILTRETADRLNALFEGEGEVIRQQMALKALNELTYRLVQLNMAEPEPMARQLEAMADYVRRNMK
ncbi:MAG: hypothetical protein KKF88_08205 [Alphaproteobacteria bacterium]|nr:hypothetical protein [Alphaproteobacteria bacterium]